MIKLENITANIVRITVPETLKADDFVQLAPQVEEFLKQHKKIRLLLDATEFNGWENMAAFEKHMGFVKSHVNRIEKGAIIAGASWQWMIGIFRIFVHPEIKIFDKDEKDKALQWIKS